LPFGISSTKGAHVVQRPHATLIIVACAFLFAIAYSPSSPRQGKRQDFVNKGTSNDTMVLEQSGACLISPAINRRRRQAATFSRTSWRRAGCIS